MSDVKTLQSDGIPLIIKDQTARNIIATPYDPTSGTYGAGDVCINGNQGYKALVDISTPEAFDPTKWEPTTLGELYTELKSNLTDLESEVDDKLKLTVIRSVATWNVGSSYTFTQEDWDKYTEFHVFISHANVANPSYYEVVFNKYFYTVQRIVGYGGTSGNNYVQMSGDATNKRLTLNAAVNASTAYNPLIGIYGR